MAVLFISRVLWDWGLTWCVAFLAPFLDWLDFLLSAMERLPLPFGEGGSGASSSKKPTIPDLNLPATEEDPHDQKSKSVETAVYEVELSKIQQQKDLLADPIGINYPPTPEPQAGPFPTQKDIEDALFTFLSSFGNRKVRTNVFQGAISKLDLNVASPEKRKKIRELINELSRTKFSAYEAKEALVKEMGEGRRGSLA
ncbi:Uncharacterized protein Adt_21406 [Abeliophyllum distichum]|uniref:Uncharacterized protein n=1 Tax=Abeliophyllum distichum TaxID=126358 RepID=A0ABD1SZ86_9LAMI